MGAVVPFPQQHASSSSRSRGPYDDDGVEMANMLSGRRPGERVDFGRPLQACGQKFIGAVIEREMGSAHGAQMVTMLPQGRKFILKFEDVHQELAALSTLQRMNAHWRSQGIFVCGMPVEAVTYNILPLGSMAGLIEVVPRSCTLRELANGMSYDQKHLRVVQFLRGEPHRLDRLAATTAAYLAAGYALGVRDGHDDNIMMREDGSLFRVDFGYIFGRSPEVDAPGTIVPRAVAFALGEHRWAEVVSACTLLLASLSNSGGGHGVAWDFLRGVQELRPYQAEARLYTSRLNLEAFNQEVREAPQWSLQRAVKNTLRDVKSYVLEESQAGPSNPDFWGFFDGSAFEPRPTSRQQLQMPVDSRGARPRPVSSWGGLF